MIENQENLLKNIYYGYELNDLDKAIAGLENLLEHILKTSI